VWEVISVIEDNDGDLGAADHLDIPLGLVRAATDYYGAFREEIDDVIDANRGASDEAHAASAAGRAAFGR
jgi:hypothetical protein